MNDKRQPFLSPVHIDFRYTSPPATTLTIEVVGSLKFNESIATRLSLLVFNERNGLDGTVVLKLVLQILFCELEGLMKQGASAWN